ncbi:MAG TPA: hypothetical protein VNZ45_12660, partial [Bacteroidia bacterium]|nr:hypothetical protein [Bacteroidia bacterium]
MTNSVIVLESEPGIQRDGTPYDSKKYIDGQWVRFYRGRPRKIGGYKLIDQGTGTLIRTVYNYDNPNRPDSPKTIDTYLGRSDSVVYENFDLNGNGNGEVDRTPSVYYIYDNINNLWTFETFITSAIPTDPLIVAHVAQNADDVSNSEQGPIFWGNTSGNLPLEQVFDEIGPVVASGGIVFAPPILIAYGNNGLIRWSKTGEIASDDNSSWPADNNQIIANTKIIKMLLTRSSGQPQLLAWTLGSLLSLSYSPNGPAGPQEIAF